MDKGQGDRDAFFQSAAQAYIQLSKNNKDLTIDVYEQNIGITANTKNYAANNDQLRRNIALLQDQADAEGGLAGLQKNYDDAVAKAGKSNFDFAGTTEVLTKRLDAAATALEGFNKLQLESRSGSAGLSTANALASIKPELLAIDTQIQQSSGSFEEYVNSWNHVIANAEKTHPELGKMIDDLGGIDQIMTVLRMNNAKTFNGFGEAAAEAQKKISDTQRRLDDLTREVRGLLGLGQSADEAYAANLETTQRRLQIVKTEIDNITTARINLNKDVGAPIPSDREARISLQNTYDTAIKVRDEIRAAQRANSDFVADVVKAQQLASEARTNAVKTELIAAKLIAENQIKRVSDERQMTAEIVALSKEREERARDEAGSQRSVYGAFYKEQLDNLIKSEDVVRRLRAEQSFNLEQGGSLRIPVYGKQDTKLANIAIPAQTQAEDVASIRDSVKNIETHVVGATGSMGAIGYGPDWTAKGDNAAQKNAFLTIIGGIADEAARKYKADPAQVKDLATRIAFAGEASWGNKTSPKGAQGVMQLVPGTAARFGVTDPFNETQNVRGGTAYAAYLLHMFHGDEALAAAAYNAGEGAVMKYGNKVPPYDETQKYVRRVMGASSTGRGQSAYNYETPTSPKFQGFKQQGSYLVGTLSASQMAAASSTVAASSDILNQRAQGSYVGSPESIINLSNLRISTGKKELEQFKSDQDEMALINQRNAKGFYDNETHKQQIFTASELARKKTVIATHDTLMNLIEEERIGWRNSEDYKRVTTEQAQIRVREAYNKSFDDYQAALADQKERAASHEKYLSTIHLQGETTRLKFSSDSEDKYSAMLDESNSGWRNSVAFRLAQWRNFEVSRVEVTKAAEDELAKVNYDIAHVHDNDLINVELARKKAILELLQADNKASISMAENAEKLADAQIYHANRANASLLDYFAKQKSVDQIVVDAKTGVMEGLFKAIDTGLGKVTSKLGIFGDAVKSILDDFARLLLNKAFMVMFGLTPAGANNQGGGSGIGTIISGILGRGPVQTPSFGGGFNGIVGNGNFGGMPQGIAENPQAFLGVPGISGLFGVGPASSGLLLGQDQPSVGMPGSVTGAGLPSSGMGSAAILQALYGNKTAGQAGGLSGLLKGIGPILPMLGLGIGASLGAGVGGQSKAGNILGTIGGGAVGVMGGLLAGSALFGTTALSTVGAAIGITSSALLAGATFGIGGALLLGAYILSVNAKRRNAEKQRAQLSGDAKTQLNTLLNNVRRDKMSGDDALAQAVTIRADYLKQAGAITDSKTRGIALKDVSSLDAIIAQIKIAAVAASKRQQLNSQLVSEFATGGRVPGVDLGFDSVPALLRPNEVVLNQRQQAIIGQTALAKAGIPGIMGSSAYQQHFGNGGYTSSYSGVRASDMVTNIYVVADQEFAEQMATNAGDKIVSMSASNIKKKGKLYSAITNI